MPIVNLLLDKVLYLIILYVNLSVFILKRLQSEIVFPLQLHVFMTLALQSCDLGPTADGHGGLCRKVGIVKA